MIYYKQTSFYTFPTFKKSVIIFTKGLQGIATS